MSNKKTIKKTKLIRLLSTFSPLEWKRFGRFVQSPYHNSNQTIVKFYAVLKKYYPFVSEEELGQETLFKKVFGKEDFKNTKLQNLCSDLYGLAEDFLIDVYFRKEYRQRKKVLVDALAEREYNLFKKESERLIQEVETQDYFLDSEDFLLLYQLNNQYFHHIETDKFTIDHLELEKAQAYLEAFHEDASIQIKSEHSSAEGILKAKKSFNNAGRNQLRILYSDAIKLNTTKQVAFYFQYKERILSNWDQLKPKHKINLLVYLINFSFSNELIQKEVGFSEALSLYKLAIQEKLFVINGKMRDVEFFSICAIGFKLESREWTIEFIKTHKKYLPIEIGEFLVPLVYAYDAIFQKDYEKVILHLSRLKPVNNLHYLRKIKSLLIRAYFEGVINGKKEYQQPLKYEMNSFKKLMNRNDKLSNLKIQANLNFIALTEKLLTLIINQSHDLAKIQKVESQLAITNPLVLRNWLEEKIIELKNVAPI